MAETPSPTRETRALPRLNQTAPFEVADVFARGALDHLDGELEQANFPGVINALNDGAERFVCIFDATLCPIDDGTHRIAQRFLCHIGFTKLKAVT